VPNGGWPALVLNADFRPLSYYPLSLWSWQDAIKAVFLDRVNIVAQYDKAVHSPSLEMMLPSVVSLKTYVKPSTHPAFTRFNVFLRDKFCCQFCGSRDDLTFDHLIPRSHGGQTVWGRPACGPRKCRSSRAYSTCTATADCSRRTICTIAGSTISIGTPSWSLNSSPRLLRRAARRWRAPRKSARCSRRATARGNATRLHRSA